MNDATGAKNSKLPELGLGLIGLLSLLAGVPLAASSVWVLFAGAGSIADVLILAGVGCTLAGAGVAQLCLARFCRDLRLRLAG